MSEFEKRFPESEDKAVARVFMTQRDDEKRGWLEALKWYSQRIIEIQAAEDCLDGNHKDYYEAHIAAIESELDCEIEELEKEKEL